MEFLQLPGNTGHNERDMETAVIIKMQQFMLELGKGFAFIGRQKRITADNDHFHYNDLCGVAQQYGVILNSTCHALAVIAPDPATNIVTVSTTSTSQLKSSATTTTELSWKIYQIKILNQQGNLLKTYSYPSGISTISVDVSSLSNGTYTLQMYDNSNWTSQQIVILR